MPSRTSILAALVTLALSASAAHAQAVAAPVVAEAPVTLSAPRTIESTDRVEPKVPRHLLSPMVAEMFDAMDEQRTQVRALKAELARTHDASRVFQLQKSIAAAKQAIELRLLRIQAAHARRDGRIEVAQGLEAAIDAMTAPRLGLEPIARPAPVRDDVR